MKRLFIPLVCLCCFLCGCKRGAPNSEQPKPKEPKQLDAELRFQDTDLLIEAKARVDWSTMEVRVNTNGKNGGFLMRRTQVSEHTPVFCDLEKFADAEGHLFDPRHMKVWNVSIIVTTADDRYELHREYN
jgi:hypothetical protein